MMYVNFEGANLKDWFTLLALISFLTILTNTIYNLFFHPLAHVPGPILARVSGIPSWYYAYSGNRHIWLWQQFQIYGTRFRASPNTVLFCDPKAHVEIYGTKSNVQRSKFYTAFQRDERDKNTLNTVDIAEHAYRRKLLNLAFTEKSVRAASEFVIQHTDRWNRLLVEKSGSEWSAPVDFSQKVDYLIFDIMGDLCFGKSFNTKEPEENTLRDVPHDIIEYMKFSYLICRSPFLDFVVWLKPRGLNRLFALMTPPRAQRYYQFVYDSVTEQIALHKAQTAIPEAERRKDIFYFLCEAKNPDTGTPAYDEIDLRAEANLLIVAGSDTTAVSLSGIFFYLTGNQYRYQKLVKELRSTFESAEDIIYGPKLKNCTYLRACIDESMRLSPSGPSELSREVLADGITIQGQYYPKGTIVGTSAWVDSRNQEIYGDPEVFRPERWIVNEEHGVFEEDVARIRSNFYPFSFGAGSCVAKHLVMSEIMIVVARTLHRLDVRRVPGSTVGAGAPEMGWGARDRKQFHLVDAFVALRRGPEVQFRMAARNDT